jgi:hypothetical protein
VTENAGPEAAPTAQMWSRPPDGTYLPRLALVDWTRLHEPVLTVYPDGAVVLEGSCTEPLGPETASGYDCVAEAVGWRWRFQGAVDWSSRGEPGTTHRRVSVVVRSMGPVVSEAARSGRALQT